MSFSVFKTVSAEGVVTPVSCFLKLHNQDVLYCGAWVFISWSTFSLKEMIKICSFVSPLNAGLKMV